MDDLLREYLPIIVFFGLALALGLVFMLAALVVAVRRPDPEKVSAYECGLAPWCTWVMTDAMSLTLSL